MGKAYAKAKWLERLFRLRALSLVSVAVFLPAVRGVSFFLSDFAISAYQADSFHPDPIAE
jgi:hypothetical protein